MRHTKIVLLALTSFAATAWAGGASIQGRVTDAAGQPIKNAEIRVEPRNGGNVLATAKTDAQGRYATAALPTDTYRVSLIVNGAVKSSINNTKTRANKATELNFELKAAATAHKAGPAAKKHLVWVPSRTGSHMGGSWVEVDENGNAAADALNVQKANAEELQRQVQTMRPVTGGH